MKKKTSPADVFSDEAVKKGDHYATALLEGISDQVKGIAESVDLTRSELKADIAALDKKLSGEIEITQKALDFVHKELKQDIARVEQRLTRVEEKLDPLVEKVERHDKDITRLKSATALA